MSVLCVDTATDVLVVGLVDALGTAPVVLAETLRRDVRAQSLLDLVDDALAAAQVDRSDLELVVVGVGPGAFTGLRIGVAAARGIAIALGIPLVGVPTPAAIAAPRLVEEDGAHDPEAPAIVRVVIDARRGELFVQDVGRPPRPAAGAGPVVDLIGALELHGIEASEVGEPEAPTVRGIALAAFGRPVVDPRRVVPEYGREPDVTPRRTIPAEHSPAPARGGAT